MSNIQLYRKDNIQALFDAIQGDEYNDVSQEMEFPFDQDLVDFVKRNLVHPSLECGAGSGLLANKYGIVQDYYLEPSNSMLERLQQNLDSLRLSEKPVVYAGVIECIPDQLHEKKLNSVVFLNGFFQVRSDYEAFIEVNRVLEIGGRFITNILTDDTRDIICGRVLGFKNYIRVIREFGFDVVEARPESGFICVEKVAEFDLRALRKMQLVKQENGQYIALNFIADGRDQHYV